MLNICSAPQRSVVSTYAHGPNVVSPVVLFMRHLEPQCNFSRDSQVVATPRWLDSWEVQVYLAISGAGPNKGPNKKNLGLGPA
jgi:hypothetical protein